VISSPPPPSPPSPPTPSGRGVCPQADLYSVFNETDDGEAPGADTWLFDVSQKHHPSCSSSAGGVNDLGTTPHMCQNDPTSVRIEITPGKAECLQASMEQCKIPMHDSTSLDYDFYVDGCNGIWAAPLWMTPDKWQWGNGSGEIDSMEFCPRDALFLNFAGGGHQVKAQGLNIDKAEGHISVRKDAAGIVTIASCSLAEATANAGQCPQPQYSGCKDCLQAGNPFACWCNADSDNIYGSGGCRNGGDCMWSLVSDAWNGLRGDSGYAGCMTAAGDIQKMKPNLSSKCAFSVEKIRLRGNGPSGSLRFGPGSPQACSIFSA